MKQWGVSAGLVLILTAIAAPWFAGAADIAKARDLYRRANALFDQGQYKGAVEAYNSAIAEDSQFADAYHNLALATEMVDRKQAIEAWKRFIEVAAGREEYKFDVARVQARMQILGSIPPLPEAMQPARYVPDAGDYYFNISRNSEGEEWGRFPVKVFLGSAPIMKWQEGARDAFDTWAAVFPLQLVALREQADIRVNWEGGRMQDKHVGEEQDWVQLKREGEGITARKYAIITMDLSMNWSKNEMRAIVTHEHGHALGINGHSDSKEDIMYMEMQRKTYRTQFGGFPITLWKSLVKQPSGRDMNTLIRLYNHAGSSVRFR